MGEPIAERDIRDRVAEALCWRAWGRPAETPPREMWKQTGVLSRGSFLKEADELLALFGDPSVGLTIGRSDVG